MMDLREKLAFIMWHQEAKRSAPNVANRRTEESFRDEGDKTRDVWLGHADSIIAALPSAIIRMATERDELLNQNDSLKHSIDVLERRLAAALGKEGE